MCDFEDVSDDELIENVEEELDEIAAELAKLKRRLDACLKFKQKDLLCKIKKLNDQIQTEQEATELARFEELNKLSKDSKVAKMNSLKYILVPLTKAQFSNLGCA